MRSAAIPIAFLVAAAYVLVAPPATAAADECVLTGVAQNGQPIAPPCLTISCTEYASGNCTQFYDNCSKVPIPGAVTLPPSTPPVPPAPTTVTVYPPSPCKTYYVFLVPDYDGQYPNCLPAQGQTPQQAAACAIANWPYTQLIWVESSASGPCATSLQRTSGGCPRDTPLALI